MSSLWRWLSPVAASAFTLSTASAALAQDAPSQALTPAWQHGSNPNPASPLVSGPLTWSFMVDSYYGYAFNGPADHVVFPTTTAPRHNEFNLNLGMVGAEVTGLDNVSGKLVLQAGNYVDTIVAPDPSVGRGAYSGLESLRHVQQAWVGYTFPVLGGTTFAMGLFPAYIGLDSYVPQENWLYTHTLPSDFTPYYLSGARLSASPRPDLVTSLWLVNGWQTMAKVMEAFGYGYHVNWTPSDRLSLTTCFLGGNFEADVTRTRLYFNSMAQWKYALNPFPGVRHLALAAVADVGHNSAGTSAPATWLGGAGLLHRVQFDDRWGATVRGSVYHDPQRLVALAPPLSAGVSAPPGDLTVGELTAGVDYKPSPWVVFRLEVRRDMASVPFVSGPGGISGASPDLRTSGDRVMFNTTFRL